MTNGIAGLLTVAAPVNVPNAEARLDEETGQVSFASLFAGAAQALAQQPVRLVEKPEGTSELDASSDAQNAEDADDKGDVRETDKPDDTHKADANDKTPVLLPRDPAPSGIDRSIVALDPALQERLGRVMARMREETGHEVQVGETYRTQSRQNSLYAQGRSAPGPVVTWTQSSKHTQGRAVDLVVDGGSAGSDAYATLRRIATQEGLRTLGERDPGHIELPSNLPRTAATPIANANAIKSPVPSAPTIASPMATEQSLEGAVTTAAITAPAAIASIPKMPVDVPNTAAATVARVAQIAPTARVVNATVEKRADVARVAPVARPGVANSVTRVPATQSTAPAPAQGSVVAKIAGGGNQRFGANAEERSQQNTGDRDGTAYGTAYSVGRRAGSEFTVPNIVASTSAGTSAAHRAAEIVATREDAPARPLSQIVMAVDAGNGTTDRIQLNLRGSSLNAKIDTDDQHAANAMGARKSELVRALTRDGLEVESLEVRATATVTTLAAAESAHRSSDSSSNARSERGAQWQQQQHRQRSENERRQQQRDERGGKK